MSAIHYAYDFGDGFAADSPSNSAPHSYDTVGTFVVTVQKKNDATVLAEATTSVTVTDVGESLHAKVTGQSSAFY
jgi:hypothetical protein